MEEKRRWSLFPKPVGGCIEPLTRPVFKAKGLAGSRIITEWNTIVGESLSQHCMPEKLSFPPGKKTGGTLAIAVENGFAPQLQHMQPLMLERLATYFGYKAIERITISHTYVLQKTSAPAPLKKVEMPAQVAGLVGEVEDDDLRAALSSFASTLSSGGK